MITSPSIASEIGGIEFSIRELTTTDVRAWLKDLELAAGGTVISAPARWWKRMWRKFLYWLHVAPKPIPAVKRDVVDVMMFDDFVMFDLRYLTDLTEQQIAKLTPRQIRKVWADCEEVNPDFFRMRRRMETMGIASPAMHAEISKGTFRS